MMMIMLENQNFSFAKRAMTTPMDFLRFLILDGLGSLSAVE